MKAMKTPRGTARAKRRKGTDKMLPPSVAAQAQQQVDRKRANRKRATAMYHKAGVGI